MDLMTLKATLTLNTKEFDEGLDKSKSKMSGFGSTMSSFGSSIAHGFGTIAKVGVAAVGAATAAVTGFGVSAVKTRMEFDSAMSQVSATLGFTTADIKENVNGAGDAFKVTINFLHLLKNNLKIILLAPRNTRIVIHRGHPPAQLLAHIEGAVAAFLQVGNIQLVDILFGKVAAIPPLDQRLRDLRLHIQIDHRVGAGQLQFAILKIRKPFDEPIPFFLGQLAHLVDDIGGGIAVGDQNDAVIV